MWHTFFRQGNIRARILKALLGVAVISLVSFAVIALDGMRRLGQFSIQSSTGLGQEALKISKAALESTARERLLSTTVDQANLCDAQFKHIEATLGVMADIAERVWKDPAAYPRHRSYPVAEVPKDPSQISVYQYRKGTDASRYREELATSSSMDVFFRSALNKNPTLSDFDIGTPSGLFRRFPWGPVSPDYDVFKRDWYRRAVESGKPGWSEPYVGAIARNLRINYSAPIFSSGKLAAVVAVNVPLQTVNERIINSKVNQASSALLIDHRRKIIAREGMSTSSQEWADPHKAEIFSLQGGSEAEKQLEAALASGKAGLLRGSYRGKDSFVAYAPVKSTGWSVLLIEPIEAIYAPVVPTEQAILKQAHTVSSQVLDKIRNSLAILTCVFFVIVACVYLVARRTANLVTDPILALDQGARIIGDGNLEHVIEVHSGDEIEALAGTFNKMTADLKAYIANLTETTAAKERIQSELKVATDIQASLLPRLFPAFPDRKEFDIYAHMDPAKEVGGDFYDFFLVDDHTLCFLIADVSDKGVPAALYMMVAKTLIKTEALRGLEPDQILFQVNNQLAPDNESCMFVTVFCALMDTVTGEVRFANAGHNPPLVYRPLHGFEYLKIQAGFVVGPMADSAYVTERLTLKSDDVFFLYTDGVTEAKNPQAELYGEKRLQEALNRTDTGDLDKLVHAIREGVYEHANGAPQSDDVTMLAIRFNEGKANA